MLLVSWLARGLARRRNVQARRPRRRPTPQSRFRPGGRRFARVSNSCITSRQQPLSSSTSRVQNQAWPVSPASTAAKIARGKVWVWPGMLPASINVVPNSPRARAKLRLTPATRPGIAKGSTIWRRIRPSLAPRLRATWGRAPSICSREARAERTISGKAATAELSTVACQLNTISKPTWPSRPPIGP